MAKIKITVIKTLNFNDLFPENPPVGFADESQNTPCPIFKEGQELILETANFNDVPKGFCGWAWADIHKDISHLLLGGYCDWVVPRTSQLTCCTDGMRPVIFKLEKIED